MKTRILSLMALSLNLSLVAAPSAFASAPASSAPASSAIVACGDDHKEAGKPVPANALTVSLKVTGMSCGDCADAIRNALLKLDGVYDAAVNYETGVANVQIDGTKVDQAKLSEAIVKAGFKVEPAKG